MEFWIKTGQLLLSLSILVVLHEFGHYLPAVLFKTRVEKFYLFFDPWFSLFKKKIKDTEWGIGWLPLGGYVKIAGMVDESMDKEQLSKPAQPWEFRSKKTWQRLIIMVGGVTVNLIVGVIIYIFLTYTYGEKHLAPKDMKYGMAVDPYLNKYGIHSGDKILKVNGESLLTFEEAGRLIFLQDGRELLVEHPDGKQETIVLPEFVDYNMIKAGAFPAFGARAYMTKIADISAVQEFKAGLKTWNPGTKLIAIDGKNLDSTSVSIAAGNILKLAYEKDTTVVKVSKSELAGVKKAYRSYEAGIRPEDLVVSANGERTLFHDQLTNTLKVWYDNKKTKNKAIELQVKRNGRVFPVEVKLHEAKMGIAFHDNIYNVDAKRIQKIKFSFGESISHGMQTGYRTLSDYISQMRFLFTEKGASSIGGFGTMGKLFSPTWDWHQFWLTTALISIILAFMNILPIPALDGGHVVFLVYEMITGREAPQKLLEYAQIAGIVLLLSLMLYANGNDIYHAFFK